MDNNLRDSEKMRIGMFGHPLEDIEDGLAIVADLKVASREAVGTARLPLLGQPDRIELSTIIDIPPILC